MSQWLQLLDVQVHDSRLDQLRHRLETLPERARLAAVEDQLARLATATTEVAGRHHELRRDQQRLEDEIATVEVKRTKANDQLYSGGSDVKLLRDLQDEVASLGRRISALEDDELEIMERLEPIEAELAGLEAQRAALDEQAASALAALAEAEAAIAAEQAEVETARAAAVAGIDDDALAQYEQARRGLGGVAVARLEGSTCGACHVTLSAVELDRLRHLPPNETLRCEECNRFLVRV